ncbi:hypothetical protein PL84_03650 [Vibrio anguillarum]|uniref:hypothetical protein n=1 Tax=Vibrio anguillarum TaxID=55601 RepID=UPI00097E248E|nr:hypothetical protein [Vibrio anguillarum]MBT2909676.1 hypothetical protein [Vibrio anguillarum]MBT2942473.1 hypothetical protein [Vibrio anguillarum]MBT2950703.1 hypothetical protein [Vibrio anguillarum]MBT2979232.1 hypothetical protein [Vibrio anguillarum]
MNTSVISEAIKTTVRAIFMRQAKAKADWIFKVRDIKQSDEYKSEKGASARFAVLERHGYGKTHINLAQNTFSQLLERMEKDAEHSLLKIDVAVAKRLSGLEIVKVECLACGEGKDGFVEGSWRLSDGEGKSRIFSFETVYAGGYNIQCLHVRTRYTLSKPR